MGQGATGVHSYTPIQVPGWSNVVSVSADFPEPGALPSDGTIWMRGGNNLVWLGQGTPPDPNVPG